jgi:tetratricopeptide (TPR) repeat protein
MRDDIDGAARFYERAQEIRVARLPAGHAELAVGHADAARIAMSRDDHALAERELHRAIAILEQAGATSTHGYAASHQNLGVVLARVDRHAEAETHYQRAYEVHLSTGGPGKPSVADCLQSIGIARLAQGDSQGAIGYHERALRLRREHHPDELLPQTWSLVGIAEAARAAGDERRAALADVARADLLEQLPEPKLGSVAFMRTKAARTLLDLGDTAAATPLAERAYDYCAERYDGKWPLGETASLLAECRLDAGRIDEALALARTAVEVLSAAVGHEQKRERAEATLARIESARAVPEGGR